MELFAIDTPLYEAKITTGEFSCRNPYDNIELPPTRLYFPSAFDKASGKTYRTYGVCSYWEAKKIMESAIEQILTEVQP